MEKIVGIYGLRNTITNKWYVGQSRNIYGRWRKYRFCVCPNQPKLRNALKKYGYDAFDKVLLEICINDKSTLDNRENFYIEKYNSINNGYNCKSAGSAGSHDAATRQLIGEASLKRWQSPEYRSKTIAAMKARIRSETSDRKSSRLKSLATGCTHTQKLSVAMKALWADPSFREKRLRALAISRPKSVQSLREKLANPTERERIKLAKKNTRNKNLSLQITDVSPQCTSTVP